MVAWFVRYAFLATLYVGVFGFPLASCGPTRAADPPPPAVATPSATATASAPPPSKRAPADVAAALASAPPFERVHSCATDCVLPTFVPDGQTPAPGAPLWHWEATLAPRAKLAFPRDPDASVLGVVFRGEVLFGGQPFERLAFHARGGELTLEAGPAGARVLVAVAVARPERAKTQSPRSVADLVALRTADAARAKPLRTWTKRPLHDPAHPPKFEDPYSTSMATAPSLRWAEGAAAAEPLLWDEPETRLAFEASLTLLSFGAGAAVNEHVHAAEWEALAIVQGGGIMTLGEGATQTRTHVRPGQLLLVPAGTKHAFHGSPDGPLVALQLYGPPGPELRFRSLAAGGR